MQDDTEKLIQQAALRYLSMREHSKKELLRKLQQKGFSYCDSEPVVASLSEHGYQSDQRYAQMLVNSRIEKGYGEQRIRAELQENGVACQFIAESLEGHDWESLCRECFDKKYNGQSGGDLKARQKQQRYLLQKGYSYSQIQAVLGH